MHRYLAFLAAVITVAPILVHPAEPGSQQLEELDEVVVSGARLADRVLALEESFYQLYNELNKDDQFDMYCTKIPLRRGSPEMTRACLPMFYADALSNSVTWHSRCQSGFACYTPPDPTAVLFARNQELLSHMKDVINSDPRLKEMNDIINELAMRLRAAEASSALMKRNGADENGETTAQRRERLQCLRPGPSKGNTGPCPE